MAGRHHQAGTGAPRKHSVLAIVVIVLLAAMGGAGTWLLSRHKPAAEAKSTVLAATNCATSTPLTLTVQVAPNIGELH